MNIPSSSVSEKCQTTLPSEIRDMFGIKAKEKILWIQVTPGLISLASVKNYKKGCWTNNICGKYANKVDAVQSLLNDRKNDLDLENRGYLNN